MPIPALPLFKHRDTVVTPADQNQFVTQFETTMDTMSNDVIPSLNLAITDINGKVITATTARDESVSAKNIAVDAKDEALTAVATLQEGAIDDTIIAPNKAFSNQYIENNYYDKTETYNKTEVDTEINNSSQINTLPDKPTPADTDNLALQETGGPLKKLSFANLKNTLFNGAISLTQNGYIKLPTIMGGLTLQWGSSTADNVTNVTFPIAFSNECFNVQISFSNSNNSSAFAPVYLSANSMTKNGFSYGTGGTNHRRWLAVGY